MRDLLEIRSVLHAYRDFSECIVEEITVADRGTTVSLSIDYIWQPDGTVRPDTEQRLIVELSFGLVQELDIQNGLTTALTTNPSLLDWGFAEIARVEVLHDERSARYEEHAVPYHHFSIRREGSTWIQIIFSELTVTEKWGIPPFLQS